MFRIMVINIFIVQPQMFVVITVEHPYIADTIGELDVGCYKGPAVAEGFYKYYTNKIRT